MGSILTPPPGDTHWQGHDEWLRHIRSMRPRSLRSSFRPADHGIKYEVFRELLREPDDRILKKLIAVAPESPSSRGNKQIIPSRWSLALTNELLGSPNLILWEGLNAQRQGLAERYLAGGYFFLGAQTRARVLASLADHGKLSWLLECTVHDLSEAEWRALSTRGPLPEQILDRLRPLQALELLRSLGREVKGFPPLPEPAQLERELNQKLYHRHRLSLPESSARPDVGPTGFCVATVHDHRIVLWGVRDGRPREQYATEGTVDIERIVLRREGPAVTPYSNLVTRKEPETSWRSVEAANLFSPVWSNSARSYRRIEWDDRWEFKFHVDAEIDSDRVVIRHNYVSRLRSNVRSSRPGPERCWSLACERPSGVWFHPSRPELFVAAPGGLFLSDRKLRSLDFYPTSIDRVEVAGLRWLITRLIRSEVVLIDLTSSGRPRRKLRESLGATHVHVSPDAEVAAGIDSSGRAKVWSMADGGLLWTEPDEQPTATLLRFAEDRSFTVVRETGEVDFYWYVGPEGKITEPATGRHAPFVDDLVAYRYRDQGKFKPTESLSRA